MAQRSSLAFARALLILCGLTVSTPLFAVIRDGGIDPSNLGKGDWIYAMADATNKLGGHVPSVTNETSLMLYYKSVGIRYMIVKAATSDRLFNGCYGFPQFTTNLVNTAHANGILIFGYNRSYGSNVVGEIAISDWIFHQGADGFVWDAEAEWESSSPWIGSTGPGKAWQLCSAVRANWPTKFLAHAPFPIISFHTSFPYKEFGYFSDTIMPQIYHFSSSGLKGSPSAGIDWSDVNWYNWQTSLYSLQPTNINGTLVYWTNSIKPLAPIQDVYGPRGQSPCEGTTGPVPDEDVMEFIDYLSADPNAQTAGGYNGVSFWRADLHGPGQWAYIKAGTSGNFPGIVNNIVIDNPKATAVGAWTSVRTFYNGAFFGSGSGTDTNSFGTNYMTKGQGSGSAYVQFTPTIVSPGDYDVYQWHVNRPDASTNVAFTVNYTGGSTTVFANQQTNSGNWSWLGRFNFAVGTGGYVRLTDQVSEPTAVAIADGMKFVFISGTAPPAAPSGLNGKTVSTSRIDLFWQDNSSNETNFVLARGTNSGGPYTDIATIPANGTNYSNTNLPPGTTYYYVVRAQGPGGTSPNSDEAAASTAAVPMILIQPASQSILAGQTAMFTVTASGTAPLSYQWRFKGNPIPTGIASTLSLAGVQQANAGDYSVQVTNAFGSVLSSNASLAIVALGAVGDNSLNQLNVPATATNLAAIAAGEWHSLGLHADGTIEAWGNNFDGQCDVPSTLHDAIAIAAGGYHSMAIRANGTVVAWGADDYGQSTIADGLQNIIAVAAGTWHSLALRADGTVVGWGDDTSGQIDISAELTNAVAIAAAGNHSLALKADRTVVCWGENTDSDGLFVGQSTVPDGLTNVVGIAAGHYHSLAVLADGNVVAWGDNSQGQSSVPANAGWSVSAVGGGGHSVALHSDGTVAAWGATWNGQCGLPATLSNVVAVSAGSAHTLVLVDEGNFVPRLFGPAWTGNRFSAIAQTLNRKSYALEFENSLLGTNWIGLPSVSGNGALKVLSDSAASAIQRFYRLRQW